ncbi:MAG: porphobilinogen synthase [Nitrospirota bacterium]|nr:porphobilinogen synthase [Nitrospirota bacterium]
MRRLRQNPAVRSLVQECRISMDKLVLPVFVSELIDTPSPIRAMPGVFQWPVARVGEFAKESWQKGLKGMMLFGIPRLKDSKGSEASNRDGVVSRAIKEVKEKTPQMLLMADVCLCEYTNHGHCGLLNGYEVDNDATLPELAKAALAYANAGADIVAPSDMMDGRVEAIRTALDSEGFNHTPVLSYAVKFASAFYGPFREAANSAPQFGDRRGYQMNPANAKEALLEAELDISEGADMLLVKPALPYLDVLKTIKEMTPLPVGAYQVSGEYSMIKAAAQAGYLEEARTVLESLLAITRAGADFILTYFALDVLEDVG